MVWQKQCWTYPEHSRRQPKAMAVSWQGWAHITFVKVRPYVLACAPQVWSRACWPAIGRAVEVKLVHQMFPGPWSHHPQGPAVREQPMPKPLKPLAGPKSDACWEQLLAHAHSQIRPGIVSVSGSSHRPKLPWAVLLLGLMRQPWGSPAFLLFLCTSSQWHLFFSLHHALSEDHHHFIERQ